MLGHSKSFPFRRDSAHQPEAKLTRFALSNVALAALAMVMSACASSQANKVSESSPDLITSVEVDATPVPTAYDLVVRLRPAWLRQRGTGSIGRGVSSQVILVYMDGQRLGGIDALKTVNTSGIRTVRYLDATRAATVLQDPGSEAISGAIVITSK
jgi:hypothetical protein